MSATTCIWCGGSKTTSEGDSCPPCHGTGYTVGPQPAPVRPFVEATGCLMLTPDQRNRISLRLDAIEEGLDQLSELLSDDIEEAVASDGPASHDEGCTCTRCLAHWLDHELQASVRDIREVVEG